MPGTSVSVIKNMIAIAQSSGTPAGKVAWAGTNGLSAILSALADDAAGRGILYVEDITALATLTGSDSYFVFVQNSGLYAFTTAGTGKHVNTYWLQILSIDTFFQTFGDGATTSFVFNHNLASQYPIVTFYRASTPAQMFDMTTIANVIYTSPNSIIVAFSTAPALNGCSIKIRP